MKNKEVNKDWSDRKIKNVGNEIITAVSKCLKTISANQAKTILKYGTYINPIFIESKQKYSHPSKKTREISERLSKSVWSKKFHKGCTTPHEIKAQRLAYKHFEFEPGEGCTWNGGFTYHLLKLKSKNKI